MGKKPDIMGLLKQNEKILELMYVESSRIICTNSKRVDEKRKLYGCIVQTSFGIVGIQIAGTDVVLTFL